jgi:predicted MFS family arabinose efflux permease
MGSVTAGYSPTFFVFLAARIATGAAAGVISALVVATIADRVSYERRGRAMSWVASAYAVAPILFVPAAAWLADRSGWRAIYVAFTLTAVLLVLALRRWVAEKEGFAKERAGPSHTGPERLGYLEFLKDRTRAAGAISAFFVSGGISVFILYLGAYLGERFGLTTTNIGLVFSLSAAAGLIGALGAGPLSDRLGKKPVAIGGNLVLVVMFASVPAVEGGLLLYVLLGATGLAAASRVAPLQSLVTELVSQESRGAYVALRNTLSQLGIAASASLGAMIYAKSGFEPVCYVAAALSLAAAGLLWMIKEPASAKKVAADSNNE